MPPKHSDCMPHNSQRPCRTSTESQIHPCYLEYVMVEHRDQWLVIPKVLHVQVLRDAEDDVTMKLRVHLHMLS